MKIDYLRISVTDRCNLKCIYCSPLGDCGYIEHEDILRFEEIERIVYLLSQCGIKKIRLTGGEPLVRKNIFELINKLSRVAGIEDIALTTNGVLFEQMASELKTAGLKRVNISIDTLQNDSYKEITGVDVLPIVVRGIHKAIETGITPVKINTVVLRGINDGAEQISELAKMSIDLPVSVRFIEYCPTSKHTKPANTSVPASQVRDIIEKKFGTLTGVVTRNGNGPSLYFKIKNAEGLIGFISGSTTIFCQSCNRLRLTSDGKVKPCLYSGQNYDIKKLIRSGSSDGQLLAIFEKIIDQKHKYTKLNSFTEDFSMRRIGG